MVVEQSKKLEIIPTGETLGAEIRGADLTRPLPETFVISLRKALLEHCLIFFKNQRITEKDQVDFTRYFGEPVEHVRKQLDRPIKEIFLISNLQKDGQPIGALSNEEIGFHSDLSYLPQPGTISTLYAVEVPQEGGVTQWCNGYAAYETLNSVLKKQLQGLKAVHRHSVKEQNHSKPVAHPVCCTHPETGRKSLYVSPHLTKYIVGLNESRSRQLLDQIFQHLSLSRFIWTHRWQHGDLVVWDNRCTMHRRSGFSPIQRRLLKRTQIFNNQIPYE